MEQFKQKFLKFWLEIYIFLLWHHPQLWRHITAKIEPIPPKSFSKKWSVLNYLSNEVYISDFCWHWFWPYGKFRANGVQSNPPVKCWLWGLKLKNWPVDPLKYTLSKQNMQKKKFLENISQPSIMVWPTNIASS